LADSLEYLLRMTAEKVGERIDLDQLIPQADVAMPQMPAVAGMPAGPTPVAAPVEAPPGGDPAADPLQMPV
jgi:hypothetical protein